jgi:hypothetical protein
MQIPEYLQRIRAIVIGDHDAEASLGYRLLDDVFDHVDRPHLKTNRDLWPLEDISVSDPFVFA